ncbi:hypothetical protein [Mameliella alba]|uniref:hypothetical protein n=1 Tax=Mameliella alba TaxID=561184 RepID=UPI000B52FC68|nr:hypothetical protein [Mameliella alba]MBY6122455.1 hypothetical protein [Mameliella alba]OWV39590.1 hypothetical protein CDZ95_25675 [Mameliella alba]OWV54712.1 hypothetical protein CDZ97_24340 [Mameliella alba]
MTDITFGRLTDLPLREAWKHEAHQFTPWLAENIDHLAEVIGVPLELTGTEVAVESFSADILARNPMDDSVVLIENQLEQTDHTHLGQIMTYLAGLGAQTVIWIAPAFREPHLSAIRWLNEHTADGFSFFAVKARVVRIGDSPFAPIFEAVEKPNDWERAITQRASSASKGSSELGDKRLAYWQSYKDRHPNSALNVGRGSWWSYDPDKVPEVRVVLWIGQSQAGIFVRGATTRDAPDFRSFVMPHISALEDRLGIENFSGDGTELGQTIPASINDPATWPKAQDWQEDQFQRYVAALNDIVGSNQ